MNTRNDDENNNNSNWRMEKKQQTTAKPYLRIQAMTRELLQFLSNGMRLWREVGTCRIRCVRKLRNALPIAFLICGSASAC